jgi:hypothetical protein
VGGRVGIEHHRIDANGSGSAEPLLDDLEQPAADAVATMGRMGGGCPRLTGARNPVNRWWSAGARFTA